MSINFFISYIVIFSATFTKCYIFIPLKIYNNNYFQKILISKNIEEDDLSLILYKEISLGEPKQNLIFIKIYSFLSMA